MSTLTLDHLSEPQRAALHGAASPRASSRIAAIGARFRVLETRAKLADKPVLARIHRGYAELAADLAAIADIETPTERAA